MEKRKKDKKSMNRMDCGGFRDSWYFSLLVIILLIIIIDHIFVIFIVIKKYNRIQNKHVNVSEQTSQNKQYINTKPHSVKLRNTISQEVTGIILI